MNDGNKLPQMFGSDIPELGAVIQNLAGITSVAAGQKLYQGGLSAPTGTYKRDLLVLFKTEINALQNRNILLVAER